MLVGFWAKALGVAAFRGQNSESGNLVQYNIYDCPVAAHTTYSPMLSTPCSVYDSVPGI